MCANDLFVGEWVAVVGSAESNNPWQNALDAIEAAQPAAQPATDRAIPEGWQLVPKESDFAMQCAAIDVDAFKLGDISPIGFRCSPQQLFARCYRAMLAAAPEAP